MLHVVLLEDSKLDAQLILAQLEDNGREVALTRVESRDEFSNALKRPAIDIILSDYNVPGFAGDEALILATEQRPQTPFIFVSGALGEHAAVELLKRGATDYVLKDRLERLTASVERALREASEKSERVRAEELLRERERTLSTLMSNLPGLVFRRRMQRPWQVEFVSNGCNALTGFEPQAFYGDQWRGWESVMHPDDVERVANEAERAFSAGLQLTTTYRIRTERGDERWVWERSAAQLSASGRAETVEGFATDITQQRLIEAEMGRRIEFEQQLIGIVSHDLRNPLNTIILGAAALLKQEGLDVIGTRQVRRILASAERAGRMIRDLLDFTQARLGGGIPVSPRAVSPGELVAQVVEEFEHSHPERRIEIECPNDVECAWDADRIMQALANLVGNAIAYSPTDSPISVRCELREGDVVIEVHNDGEPIPAERTASLFKPMQRATNKANLQMRSIGLGLFIVHSIAEAHRGNVSVTSKRDEGTTFRLRLPRQIEKES